MCIHRKNKLIIHSYENPTYDDQTCTPRPRYVAGPEKDRQAKAIEPFCLGCVLLLVIDCAIAPALAKFRPTFIG